MAGWTLAWASFCFLVLYHSQTSLGELSAKKAGIRFWGWCGAGVTLGNLCDFRFFKESDHVKGIFQELKPA